MATLGIRARRFRNPFNTRNGPHQPNISRLKCIKYAQVVGNAHYSRAFNHSATATALASYRAMAVRCALDFTGTAVQRSNGYTSLESTEKMNLSYWIGMTFSAIAADVVLGVRRTFHAGIHPRVGRVNPASRSLADLIGQDVQNRWHVIEGKGRQTNPNAADRRAWKAQARTIRSVNGTLVSTRSYCIGFIDIPCAVEITDPPADKHRGHDIKIDRTKYYSGLIEILRKGHSQVVRREDRTFRVTLMAFDPIDKEYIFMGLEEIFVGGDSFEFVKEIDTDGIYIGTDGIAIMSSRWPCQPIGIIHSKRGP